MGIKARSRFSDLRLRTKLLALFILVSALPLLVSGVYVVGYLAASASSRARSVLDEGQAKAGLLIERRWAEVERFAASTARDNLVTINLALSLEAPIREFLGQSLAAQSLDYLGIVGPGLAERSSAKGARELAPLVAALGEAPFRLSLQEGARRFAASVPAALGRRLVIGAVSPVYDDGMGLLGYVVAGNAFDRSPQLSADRDLLSDLRAAVGEPILVLAGGVPSVLSDGDPASLRVSSPTGGFSAGPGERKRISVGGEAYLFSFRDIHGPGADAIGSLGIGIKEAEVMAAMTRTLYGFVLVFVGALGVSALLAILFSRNVTRPVYAMLEGTRLIARGNFGNLVPVSSRDELGRLSMAFNEMSRRLGQSLVALREEVDERARAQAEVLELNRELERRIEERTAELSESNRELEQTVSYLNDARDQLVEREKMAALGQLVASIAHEINTPLASVISSNEATAGYLEELLREAPALARALSDEERAAFDFLLERALRPRPADASTAGDRERKRSLSAAIEAAGLPDISEALDDLVDMGVVELPGQVLAALAGESGASMLGLARKAFCLVRSHDIIEIASGRAATTIRALKSYSHVELGAESVEFELRDEIESLLSLYYGRLRAGVELRRDYAEVGPVKGRRDLLDQVWINLINNALQAMDYRGALEISIFPAAGGLVGISFADEGPGIRGENRDKIFKPFFSTKRKGEGSGLGLSICKTIVEEHGGSIGFVSEPGRTVFTVLLPAAGDGAA